MSEVEERLGVRDYPKHAKLGGRQPIGPSARVCLYRWGVNTSVGFDWDHLRALWRHMEQARDDWDTNSANPKAAHDKEGIERIRAAGAPRSLGIGFGDAEARTRNVCMFGARIQYPPTITLGELAGEMERLAVLTGDLAAIEHAPSAGG